jgi:beta-phosphoglucomutase-like phosphatase (HAD superfamily)
MKNFEKEVGFIWDIDGVVVDSPHELAWRVTAMKPEWGVPSLSSEFYFRYVAGRPRFEGGNIILEKKDVYERLGLTTAEDKRLALERFCKQKNQMIRELIKERKFKVFASSVIFLLETKNIGYKHAAASASKNAKDLLTLTYLDQIPYVDTSQYDFVLNERTLYSVFEVDTCGLDVKGGKKAIFQVAAQKLKEMSNEEINYFIVFEDAPSGIKAAKAAGMFGVGIVRIGTAKELWDAGAHIVVKDLSELSYQSLKQTILESKLFDR